VFGNIWPFAGLTDNRECFLTGANCVRIANMKAERIDRAFVGNRQAAAFKGAALLRPVRMIRYVLERRAPAQAG
jgi:hypothetical protein